MKLRLVHLAVGVALVTPGFGHAHDTDSQTGPLGKVSFPTSCDPKVQAAFERAVAMLHSFWYSAGEQAFRDVLKDDPQCAIATWGIASILMSNPLAGQGASPKGAEAAQAAIDEGRRIGAKTERERDYIEAVAAYYQDFATRSERERQVARAQAYEALAQKYPSDDEAQIFSALYIAGTQTQADQTYAAYLKAAAVLEDAVQEVSRPSGRRALPDPQLRRAADRRQGPHRRAPLCGHRAGGAARAAHAVAHLHARRVLAGVGRHEHALEGRGEGRQRAGRGLSRVGLHGVRVPAACPRRRGAPQHRRGDEGDRHQRRASWRRTQSRRCRRATRSSAARGRRRRSCSRSEARIPSSRRSRISRAASARRAAAISPPRERMPSSSNRCTRRCSPRRTRTGRPRSRSSGLPPPAWIALGERQVRRGAQVHARSRRPRGQEREAHRHAGPHRSRARAAGRHAARVEAARRWRSRSTKRRSSASPTASATMSAPRARRKWRATARKRPPTTRSSLALAKDADTERPELASAKQFASR